MDRDLVELPLGYMFLIFTNTMTPSIVKYQFMADEQARNRTLQKRKANLFKKMSELKILCGVDACLVMYERDDAPPDVWPSLPEAQRLIQRFHNSILASPSAMVDQKTYLQKSISKMKKDLEREKGKNLKLMMVRSLFDENALSENNPEDLAGLRASLESEIKVIDLMIKKAYEKGKEKLV